MPEAGSAPGSAGTPQIAVIVDAGASIPDPVRHDLGILTAPREAPLLVAPEAIPALRIEAAAPLEAATVAEACADTASTGLAGLLYVTADDGYSSPDGGAQAARAAVASVAPQLEFAVHESHAALMGCGWQAIEAATALRDGRPLSGAIEAATDLRERITVLALLEHPELANAAGATALGPLRGRRAIVELREQGIVVISRPQRRQEALVELRDRFAQRAGADSGAGSGTLRVAVQHASVAPAAEALGRWIERALAPRELVTGAITRHAAGRLGPEMLALAWYHAS